MTPEQIEIERKAFEEWCGTVGLNPSPADPHTFWQEYARDNTECCWDGWLARAEQSQWRPIAGAPKDGSWVLLLSIDGCCQQGVWNRFRNEWLSSGDKRTVWDPTHWMPLPPAPPVE